MPLIDDLLPVEAAPKPRKTNGRAYPVAGNSLIDTANAQPILDVLAELGCLKGKRITCPGHGEFHRDSSVAIVGNGVKCMHARCSDRGQSGFFNVVDAVIANRGGTPIEAAKWILERRGVTLPERPRVNGAAHHEKHPAPQPPPGFGDDDDPELGAHPGESRPANDGGPWLSTDRIFAPLPPPAFVVPELQIGPGRASCLAAYAGAGKTLAAQSLALAVASDRPIWGWFRHRGPMRVRHADQDQGAGTLRRYQRLARGMGIDPGELAGRLEVSSFPDMYLVDTPDDVWLRASEGIGLMILDALRGFTPGVEENDSQIQHLLMRLAKFSEVTGCAYLIAHHFGKPQQGAKPELERLRGSSGIGAALGSVFVLTGDRGEPKTITHVKSHPEASGGLVEDFALAIEDVASDDGADLHWGLKCTHKTREQIDPPQSDDARFQQVCRRILDVVKSNPGISGRGIRGRVDRVRQDTILEAIDSLSRNGRIENTGTDRAAKWVASAGTTSTDLEVDDASE